MLQSYNVDFNISKPLEELSVSDQRGCFTPDIDNFKSKSYGNYRYYP